MAEMNVSKIIVQNNHLAYAVDLPLVGHSQHPDLSM